MVGMEVGLQREGRVLWIFAVVLPFCCDDSIFFHFPALLREQSYWLFNVWWFEVDGMGKLGFVSGDGLGCINSDLFPS